MSQAWLTKFAGGDQPVWLSAAVVAKHAGETVHWRINEELDLEVQVTTQQGVPIVAVMGGLGAQGVGFWRVPAIDDQVIIAHPEGFEGDATIIALMPTGAVPADLSPTVLVICAPTGGKVHIHDGAGQAPLATKADLEGLREAILGWTPAPNDGGAALKTALTTFFTGPPTWPAGTTVLEGK